MDDKTLLERAARAAGMWATDFEIEDDSDHPVFDEARGFRLAWGRGWWNPLTDDGDALRLAVKLHLEIDHNHPMDNDAWAMALLNGQMTGPTEVVEDEAQRYKATRRAIVRAAAAIGSAHD